MIYLTYGIKNTARNKVRDDFATYPPEKKRRLAHLNRADASLFNSIPGPYEIFNELVSQDWIDIMDSEQGNDFVIIGAWLKNGLQYGQYYDDLGVVQGTPTYPIHPKIRDVAPDRYNEGGQLPRPATNQEALNIMNVVLGQQIRTDQ